MTTAASSPSGTCTPEIHRREIDLNELLHGTSLNIDEGGSAELVTAQRVIDCRCMLGECVLYDDRRHAVLWTDILGKQFHKLQLTRVKGQGKVVHSTYTLPKMLCSFGLLEEGGGGGGGGGGDSSDDNDDDGSKNNKDDETSLPLLCAWEDGFQLYDIVVGKELSPMSRGVDVNPRKGPTRLNDGRTDPSGTRFVCGGFSGEIPGNGVKEKVFKVEQEQPQGDGNGNGDGDDDDDKGKSGGGLVHEPILEVQLPETGTGATTTTFAATMTTTTTNGDGTDESVKKKAKVQLSRQTSDVEAHTTNSICWSKDGSRMFLADSVSKQICSYAYDSETGNLSDRKLLFEHGREDEFVPDGSCVDSEGYVWNAVWCHGESKGMVQRIDPSSGLAVYTVHIPDVVSQVSCCCFGGANKDILFITTACVGRDAVATASPNGGKKDKDDNTNSGHHNKLPQPHAGALYAVKVPFKGQNESRLKFTYSA